MQASLVVGTGGGLRVLRYTRATRLSIILKLDPVWPGQVIRSQVKLINPEQPKKNTYKKNSYNLVH